MAAGVEWSRRQRRLGIRPGLEVELEMIMAVEIVVMALGKSTSTSRNDSDFSVQCLS